MPRSPIEGPTAPEGFDAHPKQDGGDGKGFDLGVTTTSQSAAVNHPYPKISPEPKPVEPKLPTITQPDSIKARLQAFAPGIPRRRPSLVGSLVASSSLSDESVITIAEHLQQAVDWTDMRTAAAGVPGLLYDLRSQLLRVPINSTMVASIKDDAKRAAAGRLYWFKEDALDLIEEIQKLGPNDQSIVMAVLSGHPLSIPVAERSRAGALVQQVTGVERIGGGFGVEDTTRAGVMQALFPQFNVGLIQRTEAGGTILQQISPAVNSLDITEGAAGTGTRADQIFAQGAATFGYAFDLAGKIAGGATEAVFPGAGTDIRNFVGGTVRGVFKGLEWSGDLIIKPGLKLAGLEEGDPGYEAAHGILQFVWQALVLDAVGKAAHASKISGAAPDVISSAELNLTGAGLDYLAHPITRLVWDIRHKSPAEWITDTRAGKAFVRDVIELKRQGGDIIGKLSERYGGQKVPAELARAIADTPIEDIPRVLIDLMENPGGKTRLQPLQDRLAEVERQLADNNGQGAPARTVQLELPADQLLQYTEFPGRTTISPEGTMRGRTAEQVAQVRESIRSKGYDVSHVPEGGTEAVGPIRMEYNPATGEAVIREGHHRLGIAAAENINVPVEVTFVGGPIRGVTGANIEGVGATPAMQALSELGAEGAPTVGARVSPELADLINGRVAPVLVDDMAGVTPKGIVQLAKDTRANGGATWNPRTGEFIRVGDAPPDTYGVAVNNEFMNIARPDARILGEAGAPGVGAEVARVLRDYPEEFNNGAWVGTWENTADGKVYVDPMRVVEGEQEALIQAAKTGQQTIFDYATGNEIPVPKELIDQYAPKRILPADVEVALRAEKLVLEEAIRRAPGQLPVWRFPKKNILRASLRGPLTRWERIIAAGLKPLGKVPEWLIDELPTFPTLYSPIDTHRPINWLDHNADVVSKWLRRTGVKQPVIEEVLNTLFRDVKTGEDFFNWVQSIGEHVREALPKNTPADLRAALTEFWDRPADARTRSVVSRDSAQALNGGATKSYRNVLHDDANNPLPSMPTEFAQSIKLPSVDHAIEATSILRRGVRTLRGIGYKKANLAVPYDVAKFFLQASTAIFKPLVLITRLPALVTRIQTEQFIRAWLHEGRPVINVGGEGFYLGAGGFPIPGTSMRVLAKVFGEDGLPLLHGRNGIPLPENVGDLGMMMTSLMDLEGRPTISIESTGVYNHGGLTPKGYVFQGWADTLLQLHNDRLIAEFLRHDLDVNAMAKFLREDEWGRMYMTQQQTQLDVSQLRGLTGEAQVKAWLELKKEQVLQATAGNAELLDLVKTGKLRRGSLGAPEKWEMEDLAGNAMAGRYIQLRDRINQIEDTMSGLDRASAADRSMLRALDASRREAWLEMKRWETAAKENGFTLDDIRALDNVTDANQLRRTDPIHETDRVAATLKDQWNRNLVDLPDHIAVTKRVTDSVPNPSVAETASRIGDAYQRIAYSPLKALTKADIALTRGSLYYDYYRRAYSALERQGWAKADIEARATLYAAERVSNIMYDLGAKTSIQRALKDIFWFAPAWQEIIYTWGVKIPSQYHWPIGVPLIAAKGQLVIDLFRHLGVIQKNDKGEDIITIPLGPFDDLFREAGIRVPDTVYFRTSGLNFVTSGGVFPGLSNSAGFLLGKAAMRYGGIFKELSDAVQPFGPEVQMLPSPIVHAYEMLFGKPPGFELFSQDWQKAQFDRTADVALQYAYTELADKGIHPPHITDFKSDAKYKAAYQRYWNQLFSLKDQYLHGMMLTKFVGSTAAPASLSYTTEDEAAWKKFWSTAIEPGLKNGFGEEERRLIDNYLRRHPNSLAFATFYTAPGTRTRELPFSPSTDDHVWDEYYTGERRYKTPEEFATTLAISESRRFLVAQLEKAMKDVGDTAPEQLMNGYSRAQAIGDYLFNWDRFKEITPGAEQILKEQQALFAERYGIPVKSYEQERLAQTINYLNHISSFFTNEVGMRTSEVKSVLGDLKQLYADTGEFGAPQTKVEKQRAWYFDNVLTPYIERTSPLYEKAQRLDAAGLYTGDIYDRIRKINNRIAAEGVSHGGQDYPTPEEVFFGNRSPEEQTQAVLTWATRPPAWLSDFQQEKVGLPQWEGKDELLKFITQSQQNFYDAVDKAGISTNSKAYDAWKLQLDRGLLNEAQKYGKKGVELLTLQTGAPYQRLEATVLTQENIIDTYGQTAWNKWKAVTHAVEWVSSKLEQQDPPLSPRGNSELAVWYKAQLYSAIAGFAEHQPEFRKMMRDLSFAMPQPGIDHRSGALLFNALFFDNFDTQYVPEELTKAGAGVI